MASKIKLRIRCNFDRTFRVAIVAVLSSCCFIIEAAADDRPATDRVVKNTSVAATSPSGTAANSTEPSQQRLQKLIRELGSAQYTERRAAANDLRQIGAEAFDLLHAATSDSDPEVAASANYLLRQIDVRWVQADDSTAVRAILRQYGQEPEAVRLQRIQQLTRLPDGAGIGALCRITRFDRAPVVSRTAALAIIRPDDAAATRVRVDQDAMEHELGASARTATTWLRQYLAQLRDPAASVATWRQLVDEEAARLEQNSGETSGEIVSGLLWNLADVYRQLGDPAALAGILDRMMELAGERLVAVSVDLLEWLSENKSWEVLDGFLSKHQSQLEQNKRSLYYAALARAQQGKKELADELAGKAAELAPQETLESCFTAKDLEEHNQFEWAAREYHRSIDGKPIESLDSMPSRVFLGNLLHDYERDQEAADLLDPLVKALQNEGRVGQLYAKLREYFLERLVDFPESDEVAGRYHFYRACQYQKEGDNTRARDSLTLAIKFDPVNADVLIAMYRVPEADEKWRQDTRERIRALASQFQQKIDEAPNQATNYNQWAWLVSNTEGDFQKAIRYSHRSLELNPYGESAAASYLDTLGRCYYAAGDYENAIKYQRQAIEQLDYMQVMHRQLALFEKALAEKQEAASKEKDADIPN